MKETSLKKNEYKIFSLGHSDQVWVDAGKIMKKTRLPPDNPHVKKELYMENIKLRKNKHMASFYTHIGSGLSSWKYKFSPWEAVVCFNAHGMFFFPNLKKVCFLK